MMAVNAYIAAAAVAVVGAVALFVASPGSRPTNDELYGAHYKEEARRAAVAGLNATLRAIADDSGSWHDASQFAVERTTFGDASYQTFVRSLGQGDTLEVTSSGVRTIANPSTSPVDSTHTIAIKIIRAPETGSIESPDSVEGPVIASWAEW